MRPVDPRLEYRKHSAWSCDHCSKQFTEDHYQTFFHCDECQFDLCTDCFHGKKHHLHKHGMIALGQNTRNQISCSNCHNRVSSQYHICRDPQCAYILCQACHMTSPKPNPYHTHPLELWDPMEVYPQSGGLWHCDRCTDNHPTKQQTPIAPSCDMYHCNECEFDLCNSCYYSGLTLAQNTHPTPRHHSLAEGSGQPSESLYRPYYRAESYFDQESQQPPHSISSPQPYPWEGVAAIVPHSYQHEEGGPTRVPHAVRRCLSCSVYPASVRLIHSGLACTDVAICCRKCANEIIHYGRTCPICGRVAEALIEARA